jgi:beta-glucanase (GH16 family)
LAAIVLLFPTTGCSAAEAGKERLKQTPDGRRLELTFAEEFDRPLSLWHERHAPGGRWRTEYGYQGPDGFGSYTLASNGELQIYTSPYFRNRRGDFAENPFEQTADGMLAIVARPSKNPDIFGYRYTSGLITSRPSFAQTYGYFEIRAKLPRGKGLWPAFWLLPSDGAWPPEIDVLESIGDPGVAYVTAHSTTRKYEGVEVRLEPDAFHTFAVAWDAKELVWFVDGREVRRAPTPDDMHKPMFLLANLAVGGNWPGAPDASTQFPARYLIDHIRAYRFAP